MTPEQWEQLERRILNGFDAPQEKISVSPLMLYGTDPSNTKLASGGKSLSSARK